MAREGLAAAGVDSELIDRYLSVAEARVSSGQTGAVWQRRFTEAHGHDMAALTRAYLARQQADQPIHLWDI